jgi:hypothetical protein
MFCLPGDGELELMEHRSVDLEELEVSLDAPSHKGLGKALLNSFAVSRRRKRSRAARISRG